jgi:transcriptional regulator with XRE-family HTH domain
MTTMHIPIWTVGDRLRKAREDAGLSQQELLADMVGVSRNTVGNQEIGVGKRAPSRLLLRAWAHATGVPVEWLETGVYDPASRSATELMQYRYPGSHKGNRAKTLKPAA